jgi:hypothetical protein
MDHHPPHHKKLCVVVVEPSTQIKWSLEGKNGI